MTPEEIEAARLEAERVEVVRLEKERLDTEKQELFMNAARDNERLRVQAETRANELQEKLARLEKERSASKTPEITKEQFWEDPVSAMNNLIAAQVKPLNIAAAQLEQRGMYDQMKNQFRSQFPAFKTIEPLVDQFMQGIEVNASNMNIAIERAIGRTIATNPNAFAAPTLETPKPGEETPPIKTPITPPHLRPSAPTSKDPTDTSTKKPRPLTENERRILKEFKNKDGSQMTEDQYRKFLDSGNVVNSWAEAKK